MKKPAWWRTLFGSYDYPAEKAAERKIDESDAKYHRLGKHKTVIKEAGKPDREEWEWTLWSYIKISPGSIDTNRETRKKGVWSMDNNNIYITCPHCAAVMNATSHKVRADGEISPCVVCPRCDKHVFMQLLGWTGGVREASYSEEEKRHEEKYRREFEEWLKKRDPKEVEDLSWFF